MKEFRNNRTESIKIYNQRANIYEYMKYCKKQENGLNTYVRSINIDGMLRRKYIIYDVNSMKKFNDAGYKTKNIIYEAIPIYLNRLEDLCHIIRPISSYKKRIT